MICHQLTQGQRYQIAKLISSGKSKAEIAKTIGVHRSTIYREVSRNSLDVLAEGLMETDSLYEAVQVPRTCISDPGLALAES